MGCSTFAVHGCGFHRSAKDPVNREPGIYGVLNKFVGIFARACLAPAYVERKVLYRRLVEFEGEHDTVRGGGEDWRGELGRSMQRELPEIKIDKAFTGAPEKIQSVLAVPQIQLFQAEFVKVEGPFDEIDV